MAPERTDRYWTGIKGIVGLFVGSFVLYVFLYAIRDVPENAELTFESHPLLATLGFTAAATFVFGALPFCYFVSRDKRELAKDHPDVRQRHWLTVGVFSYFTMGLYPLWYLFARYRTADTTDRTITNTLVRTARAGRTTLKRLGSLAATRFERARRRLDDR